jgi:hypothetical protein
MNTYNVGFASDGTNEMYRKIHITPNEVFHWGITGGTIQTFDTTAENWNRDLLRCGISRAFRLMADQGMNILFVPFLTDTQNDTLV